MLIHLIKFINNKFIYLKNKLGMIKSTRNLIKGTEIKLNNNDIKEYLIKEMSITLLEQLLNEQQQIYIKHHELEMKYRNSKDSKYQAHSIQHNEIVTKMKDITDNITIIKNQINHCKNNKGNILDSIKNSINLKKIT